MSVSSYAVALEFYVKNKADYKAVKTAREKSTFDKMIAHFTLDFTKRTSPKKTWGVTRAELIEDMTYMVEVFEDFTAVDVGGLALGYRNKRGNFRIVFAESDREMLEELAFLPYEFMDDILPASPGDFRVLSEVSLKDAQYSDGERVTFDDHFLDTFVNLAGRTAVHRK